MGMNIITVLQIMDETVDAVDRIAELPTFILHHIISCLHAAERFREIKLVIQKLILYLDLSNDNVLSSQLIDKWIGLAVENGLTLRRVYMNEQMIERLIGERHLLEDLYISGCSDGLLWICYPKSLRLPTMSEGSPAFLEGSQYFILFSPVKSVAEMSAVGTSA
ncbi:hypothetical protein CUMW_157650, partial [Citrus unshiu]